MSNKIYNQILALLTEKLEKEERFVIQLSTFLGDALTTEDAREAWRDLKVRLDKEEPRIYATIEFPDENNLLNDYITCSYSNSIL